MTKINNILQWRKTLPRKVKDYIDNNLNPEKIIVIDSTIDNIIQPLDIVDILNIQR